MGSFVLVSKSNSTITENNIREILISKAFVNIRKFEFTDWVVYQTDKILESSPQYRIVNDRYFFFSGTPVYKGTTTIEETIDHIVDSILEGRIDLKNVRGSYAILFQDETKKFCLFTDLAGIHNIYYNNEYTALSNLFLGTIFATPGKLSFNRLAVAEVLFTGRQIGPDTLFNEIKRFEVSVDNCIGPIKIVNDPLLLVTPGPIKKRFNDEVDNQLDALYSYFEDIRKFANYYGVDSGLTGGHDSRMMLSLIRKYFDKYSIHSLWRKIEDLELSVAKKVALKAKVNLQIVPANFHMDMNNDQMSDNLFKALMFYDGHIRMHCFLTEEYNTAGHRKKILGNMRLGINGIGGEQYRNEEHMESPSWSLRYFVKYFIGYHIGGRSFTNKKFEEEYFKYIKSKLLVRLSLDKHKRRISRINVKKYLNELYVTSLMSVRTNAENQLSFYLTPYTDRQVTVSSYSAIPHLGISFRFQQEMIRKLDPDLAAVMSGYGYAFSEGEPLRVKIKYILKEITPAFIYQRKLDQVYDQKGNEDFRKFIDKFPIISEAVNTLRKLDIPLDEYRITSRPDLMPVYISMGYLIYFLQQKGKI